MSTIELTLQYRHSEDCKQTGCPSHEAKFTYQSTSDHYMFETGYGTIISFERGELEAFLQLLGEAGAIDYCCVDINKYAKK